MEQASNNQYEVHRVKRGRPPKTVEIKDAPAITNALAQAYAERIWLGQSPDLPRTERIKRVAAGLAGQGYSMDGVSL